MSPLILSAGQQAAFDAIVAFLLDPIEPVFVLGGYSGTGKTTLVRHLMDQLPNINKTLKLINPSATDRQIQLTATTNKAAEAFAHITGQEVRTIHSFLGLRVETNYRTNETTLTVRDHRDVKSNYLLLIDEASFIDPALLGMIFSQTRHCKILFMGDPAQLKDFKCSSGTPPVFAAGFPGVTLTEVMRQAKGNPIQDLSTQFRETVNTGEWFQFQPDGHHIHHLSRADFDAAVLAEFSRPDWCYHDSKFLAWTNKTVIRYNKALQDKIKGTPDFQDGDYAVCNSFLKIGRYGIKTDAMVHLTHVGLPCVEEGVPGRFVEVDHTAQVFLPDSLQAMNTRLKQAKEEGEYHLVQCISEEWGDFRAAYAQTVNKSQGSTYGKVFIDLDDISKCNSGNTIARMLYVGISRAQHTVYMTGDLA